MDIASKKLELISWLSRVEDESLLVQIDVLRKADAATVYESRMSEPIQQKLYRSQMDIEAGQVREQSEVEAYFEAKL